MHRRYKHLDTVFEQDQSYQVLTACSFTVFKECEMKLNSLIDSKRRREGEVISDKIYFCDSSARLETWNYELFVQNCR